MMSNLYNTESSQVDPHHLDDESPVELPGLERLSFAQNVKLDDQLIEADKLKALGDQLLQKFADTQDKADIDASLDAYEQALGFLPDDDERYLIYLHDTGMAYHIRYSQFGVLEDIEKAIDKLQTAIELCLNGDKRLPCILGNLGFLFMNRYERQSNIDDFTQSFQLRQQAVKHTLEGDPYMPARLGNLGASFLRRFEKMGIFDDLEQSIQLGLQAVELASERHSDLPLWLTNLASSFRHRFQRTGDLENISQSISLQRRALDLTPDGHSSLPPRLNKLANSFMCRFKRKGDLNDVAQSIQLVQQAVDVTPPGHPNLPSLLTNLGGSFKCRFERTRDLSDIRQSIQYQERAVDLTPAGHSDLPSWLSNLGCLFVHLFRQTGELTDVAQSIQLQQRAVELALPGDPDLPSWLNNLGSSFLCRFERTGDVSDLEQSVQLQQEAVDITPDGHADLPSRLNNLGNSWLYHFERTGDLEDIKQSIQFQQRAVALTPDGHPNLYYQLSNLGSSFLRLFERTGDVSDITQSIQLQQRAVELTPDGHSNLPAQLSNLGASFSRRFEKTGDLDDIEQSLQSQLRAVKLTPEGHSWLPIRQRNLGNSFRRLFENTGRRADLVSAATYYRTSAMSSTGPPSICLRSARSWAVLSSRISNSEAMTACERVIDLISLIAGLENTSKRRHEVLKELSGVSTAAVAAALAVHEPFRALEWLEAGRCIVWNQINQLRTPVDALRECHTDLANRLTLLSKQLEHMGGRTSQRQYAMGLPMSAQISLETEAHSHLKLAKEREQVLKTIREIPGFDSFLRPKRCADLMKAIPDNGIIVVINSSKSRCDALILTTGREEPMHVPLEKFSFDRAHTLARGLRDYLEDQHLRSRYGEQDMSDSRVLGRYKGPRPGGQIKGMLQALWTDLVDPILQSLGLKVISGETDLPRIWWCPTGPFAFLPIHAAGIYDPGPELTHSCLADYVVSSYIPTLATLDRLRSRSSAGLNHDILLASQPTTPGLPPIPKTEEEIRRTQDVLHKRGIRSYWCNGEDATVAHISESMETFSCVHLACHASQNHADPLESGIYLHDGALKLSDIMRKNLPMADLAFLSACQTSTGNEKLPEEAVHLAAGMLSAGYRSVVATMWSISDKHAPDIAETFYKYLFKDDTRETTGSSRALHTAVQALRRELGDSTEVKLLEWIPYVHFGI